MPESPGSSSSLWLMFAALSMLAWGLYGVLLHTGQTSMADPAHGRTKAFLWVGVAYFGIAIVGPMVLLMWQKASFSMPARGVTWSLIAGAAGAIGAFGVLLAFGAKGPPAVVMSIIFAGAPIVNALTAMSLHPPAGGLGGVRWPFWAGILLAACGGMLVTLYKPAPPAAKAPPSAPQTSQH